MHINLQVQCEQRRCERDAKDQSTKAPRGLELGGTGVGVEGCGVRGEG